MSGIVLCRERLTYIAVESQLLPKDQGMFKALHMEEVSCMRLLNEQATGRDSLIGAGGHSGTNHVLNI